MMKISLPQVPVAEFLMIETALSESNREGSTSSPHIWEQNSKIGLIC